MILDLIGVLNTVALALEKDHIYTETLDLIGVLKDMVLA